MDRFQVTFALRAERDLQSITRFIIQRSSVEIAARFGNSLIDRALTLATLPMRGRIVPELGEPEMREDDEQFDQGEGTAGGSGIRFFTVGF